MTLILFGLYGVLVDSQRLRPCYAAQLGRVMAERFGGQVQSWTDAYHQIVEDWDSYYADLDLNGEDGLRDLREGEVRTTGALFRLTRTPEPERETLLTLARELPYLVTRRCDAFYEDNKPVLERLHQSGYVLGIASNATTAQARGLLEGSGLKALFSGSILGPDVTERLTGDEHYYLAAEVQPQECLLVDAQADAIKGAHAAGIRTVQVLRAAGTPSPLADHI